MAHNKSAYSLRTINHKLSENYATKSIPLHAHVEQALSTYLVAFEGQPVSGLYNTLLAAIEPPLLKVVLEFCKTQEEAAKILGLSRGTLRKKLKQYHLIQNI